MALLTSYFTSGQTGVLISPYLISNGARLHNLAGSFTAEDV